MGQRAAHARPAKLRTTHHRQTVAYVQLWTNPKALSHLGNGGAEWPLIPLIRFLYGYWLYASFLAAGILIKLRVSGVGPRLALPGWPVPRSHRKRERTGRQAGGAQEDDYR